jgi:hypothetical protein
MSAVAEDQKRWWRETGKPQLNLILWAAWNPIAVGVPLDEYESYTAPLLSLLQRGEPVERIADELHEYRTALMGLPSDRERDLEVARTLRAWHHWVVEGGD